MGCQETQVVAGSLFVCIRPEHEYGGHYYVSEDRA